MLVFGILGVRIGCVRGFADGPVFVAGAFWVPAVGAGAAFVAGACLVFAAGVCCARAIAGSISPAAKKFNAVMVSFRMRPFSHGSTGFANRRWCTRAPRGRRRIAGLKTEVYNCIQR